MLLWLHSAGSPSAAGTSTMPPPPPGLLSAGPPSFGGLAGFLQRRGWLPREGHSERQAPLQVLIKPHACQNPMGRASHRAHPHVPERGDVPDAFSPLGLFPALRQGQEQHCLPDRKVTCQGTRSHVRAREREAAVFQVEILSVAECLGTQPLWTGNRFYASIDRQLRWE